MRGVFLFLAMVHLLAPATLFAQRKIVVEDVIREMSLGMQPGFEMTIPEVTFRGIESKLTKFMRQGSRGRVERGNGDLFITAVSDKNIHHEPFNLYVRHLEVQDGVRITAFYTPDDTTFFSGTVHAEVAMAIRNELREFGVARYREAVNGELHSQERILDDMEDELEAVIKESRQMEKTIKDSKRNIERRKEEIRDLKNRIGAKGDEIMVQHDIINSLRGTGGEEEKISKKRLRELEKEKKKMEKSVDRKSDDIGNLENKIDDARRAIDKNDKLEHEHETKLKDQKNKVNGVKDKLDAIR